MPKQGQFAKSVRRKQLNNFKVKRRDRQNAIADNQLTDFLTVRFALTAKKRLPVTQRESAQRFLQEISAQLPSNDGQLDTIVKQLIDEINSRVPWQFFEQLSEFWPLLQKFLQKEVPAVPLKKQILIKSTVSQEQLQLWLANALANKIAMATLLGQGQVNLAKTKQLAKLLLPSLYQENVISWEKVKALLAPFPFDVEQAPDETTRQWLISLTVL